KPVHFLLQFVRRERPRRPKASTAGETVLNVVGNFLTDGRQIEKLFNDERILGLLGQLSVLGRLVAKIFVEFHAAPLTLPVIAENEFDLSQQTPPSRPTVRGAKPRIHGRHRRASRAVASRVPAAESRTASSCRSMSAGAERS